MLPFKKFFLNSHMYNLISSPKDVLSDKKSRLSLVVNKKTKEKGWLISGPLPLNSLGSQQQQNRTSLPVDNCILLFPLHDT